MTATDGPSTERRPMAEISNLDRLMYERKHWWDEREKFHRMRDIVMAHRDDMFAYDTDAEDMLIFALECGFEHIRAHTERLDGLLAGVDAEEWAKRPLIED